MHAGAADFELGLNSPFQWGMEENGVTTITPLIIMPCKGATKAFHPGEGDIYLVLKNVSSHSITVSMRDDVPVALTFFTPNGQAVGNKWLSLAYTIQATLPKNPSYMPFVYTLAPHETHIYRINLFQVHSLVDKPLDWMAVYSTTKVKVACSLRYVDDETLAHEIHTGWIPVTVHNPETDTHEDVPEGSTVEAIPSAQPGEPPQLRVYKP